MVLGPEIILGDEVNMMAQALCSVVRPSAAMVSTISLQWRYNERDGISNHRRLDCLLNRLFMRRSTKTSKLCVTGICEGNSPVTGKFPAQRASDAENVSIWWRHHVCRMKESLCSMISATYVILVSSYYANIANTFLFPETNTECSASIGFSTPCPFRTKRYCCCLCVCPSVNFTFSQIWAGFTKFAPNMQPGILSTGIENGGHWPWSSMSFWPFWLRIAGNLACHRNNL